jgi:acyl carrier protein
MTVDSDGAHDAPGDVDATTLEQIISVIRNAIAEDWIKSFEIDADTSFSDDLELESIEFVTIAEGVRQRFGKQIDFNQWLSDRSFEQLITLNVGDLARMVHASCATSAK